MVVGQKFQEYSANLNDNRARNILSRDKDFHRAILDLEKLDEGFDATGALAEAFLKTLPTHKLPRKGEGDEPIMLSKDFKYYNYDEAKNKFTSKPLKDKADTLIQTANNNIAKLQSTITLIEQS